MTVAKREKRVAVRNRGIFLISELGALLNRGAIDADDSALVWGVLMSVDDSALVWGVLMSVEDQRDRISFTGQC